jgi:hypothetical protein
MKIQCYTLFLLVWFANINDLIRGEWFFLSIYQIIFWNMMGILSFIYILIDTAQSKQYKIKK